MGYTPENNPYIPGDPYSYDLKWIVSELKKINSELAEAVKTYGSPMVVYTAAEMIDSKRIYIYLGTEVGYTAGDWYYYDTNDNTWKSGGAYGGYPVDTALSATSPYAVANSVITTNINDIDSRLDNLEAGGGKIYKKVLFIGDSYAVGSHLSDPSQAWPHLVGALGLGLTLNSTYFVQAGAGYGIMKEPGYRYSELLQTWINNNAADRGTITHVIMGGGANDWINDTSALIAQALAIKSMISIYMPQAEVIMLPFGWSGNTQYRFGMASAYHNMQLYLPQYGIKVLTGGHIVLQNCNYYDPADEVHPNDIGNVALSSWIISALFGNSNNEVISNKFKVGTTELGYISQNGDTFTLVLPPINTYLTPTGSSRVGWWDCGEIDCDVVLGSLTAYTPHPRFTLPIIYENESTARRMYITEFDVYKTAELTKPHLYARILYPDRSTGNFIYPANGCTMYFMGGSVPLTLPGL